MKNVNDIELLEMALLGLDHEIRKLQERKKEFSDRLLGLANLTAKLYGWQAPEPGPALVKDLPKKKGKRYVSPEARAKMAAAQKRRWARNKKKWAA